MFNNYQNLGSPMTQQEMMQTKGGAASIHPNYIWNCWGSFAVKDLYPAVPVCHPEQVNPHTDNCGGYCELTTETCFGLSCI